MGLVRTTAARGLFLALLALSVLAGGRSTAIDSEIGVLGGRPTKSESAKEKAKNAVIVCDLYPFGTPAFPELEATWLYLASYLGFRGLNVTLLPIADPRVDYAGKYLVMLFYPNAFTFVCPTEILAFNDRIKEFREMGAEVVAISVDSPYAALAWQNIPRSQVRRNIGFRGHRGHSFEHPP